MAQSAQEPGYDSGIFRIILAGLMYGGRLLVTSFQGSYPPSTIKEKTGGTFYNPRRGRVH